jgi:hypothetical protein
MSKLVKRLAAVPFAHLLGITRAESDQPDDKEESDEMKAKRASWAEKAEDDPDRKQREGESDDDYAKRMEEMDDEEAKAEGKDVPDDDAEDEETKAIRRDERARCAKIIAHGIKNGCVNQAGVFAFDTSMTVAQATAALSASRLDGKKGTSLAQRMTSVDVPVVGADAPQPDSSSPHAQAKAVADRIIAAASRARGEDKKS